MKKKRFFTIEFKMESEYSKTLQIYEEYKQCAKKRGEYDVVEYYKKMIEETRRSKNFQ